MLLGIYSDQRWAVWILVSTILSYRYRLSVSLQYRVPVLIKHVFVHRRYKYTVFEHDQSCQVLTECSFTVSEECEMKLNSLIDSKLRTVCKFLLSLAYLQLFRNAIEPGPVLGTAGPN